VKCEALETFTGEKMCMNLKVRSRFVKSERCRPERIREAATRSKSTSIVRIDEPSETDATRIKESRASTVSNLMVTGVLCL